MRVEKFFLSIILLLFYANNVCTQNISMPCYRYQSNIHSIDSLLTGDVKFNMQIRYLSETEISVGPLFSNDTSENCRYITFKKNEDGNWYVKVGDTYRIFYWKEKDYLADCCIPTCEETFLSKRNVRILNSEHLYPFEVLFWGVVSCDHPTYLFHQTFGIVGIENIHSYDYFRKDFLEYLFQSNKDTHHLK